MNWLRRISQKTYWVVADCTLIHMLGIVQTIEHIANKRLWPEFEILRFPNVICEYDLNNIFNNLFKNIKRQQIKEQSIYNSIYYIYGAYALHLHVIYTAYTYHIYTLHIKISYTLHIQSIYTAFTSHIQVNL
jgi:hypothetical protein